MKKLKSLTALALCMSMLFLSGCAQNPWNEGVTPLDPATLTNAKMLEDYDYIWKMLEENCPLLNVCARQYGENLEERKVEIRKQVEVLEDGDIEGFQKVINYVTTVFHQVGHISSVGYSMYEYIVTGEKWESDTQKALYLSPEVKAYYAQRATVPSEILRAKANNAPKREDPNAEVDVNQSATMTRVDGINVIKMPTFLFSGESLEREIKAVQQFCIDSLDEENVILDIRGNQGGATDVWQKGLEPLLAGQELKVDSFGACKNTEYNRKMWADWYEKDANIQIFPIAELEKRNATSVIESDIIGLDSVVVNTDTLDYTKVKNKGGKTFEGKIWLLTSAQNYSSAEALVRMADSSGFATMVGTRTKGGGAIIASPTKIPFALPNSGIIYQYVPFYAMNSDGTPNEEMGTLPDIETGGKDALEVCLAEIAKGK